MQKLSPEQIESKLSELPQWALNGDSLQRTFRFDDFVGAMAFVNQIAGLVILLNAAQPAALRRITSAGTGDPQAMVC